MQCDVNVGSASRFRTGWSLQVDSIMYTFQFGLFILQLTKLYCSYLNKRPRIFS